MNKNKEENKKEKLKRKEKKPDEVSTRGKIHCDSSVGKSLCKGRKREGERERERD